MPQVGWVEATGLALKIMIFRVGWVGAIEMAFKDNHIRLKPYQKCAFLPTHRLQKCPT
jgi:hypothetical protein